MTPDPSVAEAVTAALQSNGHVLTGAAIRDLRDLHAHLGRTPTPIVMVDLDPQPHQVLPQLERLVTRFPASRFVALSTTLENDLLVEAMQTGVRRVVAKRTLGTELKGILDRLSAADAAQAGPRGQVLSVLSGSGGCGATTIAVNLAQELALQQQQPSLLIDLDCCYGAVASYLGLKPQYAADHVMNYSGPIDAQLLRSTATIHSDQLHLLASPASTNFAAAEPLKFDRLEQALESANQAYGNTIVDAPRIPLDAAAALVAASARTLLIFQLTVKDLRTARAMIDALRDRGADPASLVPVANRFVKRQMIGIDEAAKALGGLEVSCVRNDYSSAIHGWNYGQLLSEAGPRCTLRKDLQELLTRLSPKKPA
jgi:pilus assembly protein CpaE